MTDTITEVDMDLMRRTALRAIHPRATITAGRYGTGVTGTLIPRSIVQPEVDNDNGVHVLLLDEGERSLHFYRQTPGLWADIESRFVTLDEVTVEPLTAEQILARLPRYTDDVGAVNVAAVPPGTLGQGYTYQNYALAVMGGPRSPFEGWSMADGPIELPDLWSLDSRPGLWGWWLTSPTGTWSLPGNLPSTEPSFEMDQRVTPDEVNHLRGVLITRGNSGLWVTHGDGTATQIEGRDSEEPRHLGLGQNMPGTDDPTNCWVRDGWRYAGFDESRVPDEPIVHRLRSTEPTDNLDEVEALRRRLAEAEERYTTDLAAISEILGREARERDWCHEYEQVVDKINRTIAGELQPCRDQEQDYTVMVTVTGEARIPWSIDINVPITTAEEIDSDMVREAVQQWLNDNYVQHADPTLGEAEFDATYDIDDVEIDDEWEVN